MKVQVQNTRDTSNHNTMKRQIEHHIIATSTVSAELVSSRVVVLYDTFDMIILTFSINRLESPFHTTRK